MINRIVVGAGYGLKDWIVQRATALVMAIYTFILLAVLVVQAPDSYEAWHAIFANGFMQFMTFIFFISLFFHLWVGLRDIWMSYVKPDGLRFLFMIGTVVALVGYAGWAVKILWRL
ncbi:MAG: succinate dehydrogenase, hydrophobic membrane anchor protein [Azospira sp.]|jgi:succinate dehydrogenase / fumarate reductase membrane anchor subunit|nr:succinate dehydrogenase, hydrophobic membrane anchor protein [Azospira sp.]